MKTKRILHHPHQPNVLLCNHHHHHHHHVTKKRRLIDSPTGIHYQQQPSPVNMDDYFDLLPDDLVISILTKLSSTANSPPDFITIFSTCKRLKQLANLNMVLSKANPKTFLCSVKKWSDSDSAHRFLKLCAASGNTEARYVLGMISFYCLQNRATGVLLIAEAAIHSHAQALFSLAIIQFNGSGGSTNDKNLHAGVSLCARAAFFGHVDALRELGHCLQDGYGTKQNVAEGRRFLFQATARELGAVLSSSLTRHRRVNCSGSGKSSKRGSDCVKAVGKIDPVHGFLSEWFEMSRSNSDEATGLRKCSHGGCGRPETRIHEFRRCSVCNAVNYCSRACQALDWKVGHELECRPPPVEHGLLGEEEA